MVVAQLSMKSILQSPKSQPSQKKHSVSKSNSITNYFKVKQPLASTQQSNQQETYHCGKGIKRERDESFLCVLPKKIKHEKHDVKANQKHVETSEVIVISDSDDSCNEDANNNHNTAMKQNGLVCLGKDDFVSTSAVSKHRKPLLQIKSTQKLCGGPSQKISAADSTVTPSKPRNAERNVWCDMPDIFENLSPQGTQKASIKTQNSFSGKFTVSHKPLCKNQGVVVANGTSEPIDVDQLFPSDRELEAKLGGGNDKNPLVTNSAETSDENRLNEEAPSCSEKHCIKESYKENVIDLDCFVSSLENPFSGDSTNEDDSDDLELPEFSGNDLGYKTTSTISEDPGGCAMDVDKSVPETTTKKEHALDWLSPILCESTPLPSSQDSNCSVSPVLEKLQAAASKSIPLTPRHAKKIRRVVSENDSLENSPCARDEVQPPKRQKLYFTLNRMVREQRKNVELKQIEKKLLDNVKKGGFCKDFELSSDDEDEKCSEHLDVLSRITSTMDDCLSLPNTHQPLPLFEPHRFCAFYCIHTLSCASKPNCQRLDTASFVRLIKAGKMNEIFSPTHSENSAEILDFLIKILCSSHDAILLEKTFHVCSNFLKHHSSSATHLQQLDEAVLNTGVKSSFFTPLHRPNRTKRVVCKKCRAIKPSTNTRLLSVLYLMKLAVAAVSKCGSGVSDDFISPYVKLCCLALTISHDHSCHFELQQVLTSLLHAVRDWPRTGIETAQEVVNRVPSLPTVDHIVSSIPTCNERCSQLRRAVAQTALSALLDKPSNNTKPKVAPSSLDLTTHSRYAKRLEVARLRKYVVARQPTATDRDVFHALYAAVSMLQACVSCSAPSTVQVKKHHLEEISSSLRALSVSIRDTGCLYSSETKHFVRIAIADLHLQVQGLPTTRSYQQNIFKFLDSSRVDALVIGDDDDGDGKATGTTRDLAVGEPMDIDATQPSSISHGGAGGRLFRSSEKSKNMSSSVTCAPEVSELVRSLVDRVCSV